jgi:hypothetical protein
MKKLLLLSLVLVASISYGQNNFKFEGKRAKNSAEYAEMYQNKNIKMVRSHKEFHTVAKQDDRLKAMFDKKTLHAFLKDLTMSEKGIVSFSYTSIKEKYPSDYKLRVDYVLGFFGLAELFEGRDAKATAATHLEGYACCSPDCCTSRDSACIFNNCKAASNHVRGTDLVTQMNTW